MIRCFIMLAFLISSHVAVSQNDSLITPFKRIWYFQIDPTPYQAPIHSESNDVKLYRYHHVFGINSGYEFLIPNSKTKRNQYYVGLNVIFNQNRLKLYLEDYYEKDYNHFQPYHSFSQSEFNITYYTLGIAPSVAHYVYYRKFFIFQKAGLSINKSLSKKKFSYTETVRSSSPERDSAYITPSNPEGWYWPRNTYTIEHNESSVNYISLNPYYQLGFAYKFNRFIISCNAQVTTLRKIIDTPILSGQIGIIYGFK